MSPLSRRPWRRALWTLVACGAAGVAWADAPGGDPHAAHQLAARALKRATRSSLDVTLPAVELVRDDGKAVLLSTELGDGRPVVLTFIFTKCGTICPVMSQTFAQVQSKLGAERDKVRLVSISIDPEFDTPQRLAEYGKKVGAGQQWHFYTGTAEASLSAQRAFEAFRGDKMDHTPVTFLRAGGGRRWERIDGFASSDELVGELRQLLAVR
jgi:protein SCO1